MKVVAGLLGVMLLAACGAPAMVTPTPLNPVAMQTSTMQSYGPGAVTSMSAAQTGYTDAAPTIATGEEEEPAPEPTATPTPKATPTPAPAAEETAAAEEEPTVPIMADPAADEPAPKPTLVQKAKTVFSNVVNKVKSIFRK